MVDLEAQSAGLATRRRIQRRFGSVCFLVAGVAFGTAFYLLRARFHTLVTPSKRAALFGLIAAMGLFFWAGARAEAEVGRIDEELRALADQAAAQKRR